MSEIQAISNAILVIDDCCNAGRFSFSHISERLQMITSLGATIGKLQNIPEETLENRLKEELVNLENKISQLSEKMNRYWDVLKIFMSGNPIFGEMAQGAGTVTKFLLDTIGQPCVHSVGLFRDACLKIAPLMSGYQFITLLEQDTTNPLKKAMNDDVLKRTETFEKWRAILDGSMTHFLFIETFSNGLSWDQNMYGPEKLKKKIEAMNRKFDYSRDEYKMNYWPDTVQQLVYRIQDQNQNYGNAEKARKLKNDLEKILTDDVFYIIVCNACDEYHNDFFQSEDNQLITSFGRAGSNVVIYRSKNWRSADKSLINKMRKEVEDCKQKAKEWTTSHANLPNWIMANCIHNAGFVGLIKEELNVIIQSANNNLNENTSGPGHWTDVSLRNSVEKYILIAGFK